MSSPVLDSKDIAILKMLMKNARVSYSELARNVGLSDVAVIKRVKRLEELGIIKRYTIVVDYTKLGYKLISITGLDVTPEKMLDVVNFLKGKNYVKFLAITSGDHTIMTVIVARSSEELEKIHRELSGLPGVKRVCPAIILEVLKDEFVLV